LTSTAIAGEEQQEDLVDREALVTLSEAPDEGSSTISTPVLIILISAVGVIAVGVGIICLILKKKRIALSSGGSKPTSKKEEEAKKAVDKFLKTSMKKKNSETQKKFVGGEESFGLANEFGGLDTQ